MQWFPHSTVATIVEKEGHFLMVEEHDDGQVVFNQPAGHLEHGETLFEAARRETLEETAWHVELTALLGIYHYQAANGHTYIRHCFIAEPVLHETQRSLDTGIVAAHWLSREDIFSPDFKPRSPAVHKVLEDYFKGFHYPLDVIFHYRE